jgi:2-dehydropantoate 2-reductase
VKAQHTRAAAEALLPHLADDGVVVSAQNGLNEVVIADVVGKQRTIGCFVNFGADYLEPGIVHYSGHGAVVIGELDGTQTPRIAELHRLMQEFEPKAVLTGNIWGYLWGKLIYGTLLFATALTDDSIADVLANRRYRPVLAALGLEVGGVAKANGVKDSLFSANSEGACPSCGGSGVIYTELGIMATARNRLQEVAFGIWRDLAIRKRKTEVDAQILPIVDRPQAWRGNPAHRENGCDDPRDRRRKAAARACQS